MGFYCWIFNIISQHLFQEDLLNGEIQLKYVRRAELLLAFITVSEKLRPTATGVGGTDYSRNHTSEKVIDLAQGADKKNGRYEGTYFRNSIGVYNQYTALMASFGLIIPPFGRHKVYNITEQGKKLAVAFGKNVSQNTRSVFSNSVFSGKINRKAIDDMTDLAINIIPQGSEEYMDYLRILINKDTPKGKTCHRKLTIRLLLEYIKGYEPNVRNTVETFLRTNYESVINNIKTVPFEKKAWYLYELDELTHIGFEAFHFALMSVIDDTPRLLTEAVNNLISLLKKQYQNADTVTLSQLTAKKNVHDTYNELMSCYSDFNYGGKLILKGIELLKSLYTQNHGLFADIDKISNNYKRNGYAVALLNSFVNEDTISMTVTEYAKYMIRKAMNEHIYSSFQKSAPGKGIVHNYMIEDGRIWKIRNTESSRTTPRLQNVLQYMEDLHWIERNKNDNNSYVYILSDKGKEVMNAIC